MIRMMIPFTITTIILLITTTNTVHVFAWPTTTTAHLHATAFHYLSSHNNNNSNNNNPCKRHLTRKVSPSCLQSYRKFMEYAWEKLQHDPNNDDAQEDFLLEAQPVPQELSHRQRKSSSSSSSAWNEIYVGALVPKKDLVVSHPIRLARYALLETMVKDDDGGGVKTDGSGIQVLNLVIFPKFGCSLIPVFGADLVSLPGNKHLIAIDFQPLSEDASLDQVFSGREALETRLRVAYETYGSKFEWGGDIPDAAKRYFSKYCVWTRLSGDDATNMIEQYVYDAFCEYLDIYLELAQNAFIHLKDVGEVDHDCVIEHGQNSYLSYRKANDPARPMLKSLFGEEFTERLIGEILFNKGK